MMIMMEQANENTITAERHIGLNLKKSDAIIDYNVEFSTAYYSGMNLKFFIARLLERIKFKRN